MADMLRRFLWKMCRLIYLYIAKPILFRISPDNVHNAMIKFTIVVGKVSLLRMFVGLIFVKRRNERLAQTLHGIKFNVPVGLSAGFDKNGEITPAIAALGFGFETVGSVTAKQCDGNPRPWFYRLPKTQATVVNAGLGNDGSKAILKRLSGYSPNVLKRLPVVLSIAKTNSRDTVDTKTGIADYITTAKRAKGFKSIQMIELNISCPNAHGGEPFTTPSRLELLLSAVDEVELTQPVYVKMPVDLPWATFRDLLDVANVHHVAGVTIANLIKDRSLVKLKDNLPDKIKGNLSGKPTWQPSNDLIRQTYLYCGDKLTIIGVGGIFSADDAYTKIKLGASLVELITGMLFVGPQLAAEISDGLSLLLKRDGYTNISQAIGVEANK